MKEHQIELKHSYNILTIVGIKVKIKIIKHRNQYIAIESNGSGDMYDVTNENGGYILKCGTFGKTPKNITLRIPEYINNIIFKECLSLDLTDESCVFQKIFIKSSLMKTTTTVHSLFNENSLVDIVVFGKVDLKIKKAVADDCCIETKGDSHVVIERLLLKKEYSAHMEGKSSISITFDEFSPTQLLHSGRDGAKAIYKSKNPDIKIDDVYFDLDNAEITEISIPIKFASITFGEHNGKVYLFNSVDSGKVFGVGFIHEPSQYPVRLEYIIENSII